MSTVQPTRTPQGIRARHVRSCRSGDGKRCNCRPSWEAFVYLKREDKKLRKTFPTLAAAKARRADALAAANRGVLRGPSTVTVADAAGELIVGMADGTIPTRSGSRYKPAAVRGYERTLRLRVLPVLGSRRLTEVRRSELQDLADRMMGEGLAPSTVQNTLDPVRVIFRRALRRDVVTIDPTDGLELRRPKGRRDRIATPDEGAEILAALPSDDRALWGTAMYAGLRRGELRALRWSDVDLDGRQIHVVRGWDDQEGEQDVKSDAGHRRVPILEPLLRLLAAHKLRSGRRDGDLVFGAAADRAFVPSTVRRRALAAWDKENVARLGRDPSARLIDPLGLHEARHTCASVLIASGANPKVIQSVMGHSTITMTFDQYGHLMPGGLEEAAEAANAYLGRSLSA